ncbi:hypothetical protein WJX73_006603 [Symbiochloris irregularis]|uniref:DNA polymerase eta n=1 Tax=Symbiochloris irregularis TaxID=706552 RepID=A0AAW1PG81_9CHLO
MAEAQANRAIVHVDLDAFYAQVEQHRDPDRLLGKPVAVIQYNPYGDLKSYKPEDDRVFNSSNGSLIAVSYEARAAGVKRGAMRGDEARKVCPELQLVQVPTANAKADLTHYRDSGKQVMDILGRLGTCERASIDECYLDLTVEARKRLSAAAGHPPRPTSFERVHVCTEQGPVEDARDWWDRNDQSWGDGERLLATTAAIMVELRAAVRAELGYTCSAGIAHNKILAKLASGMHKPMAETVVPLAGVPHLLESLPVSKLRQLGGKFGNSVMSKLGISTVGELATFSLAKLDAHFGEQNARWLHNLARGFDEEEVQQRTLPKSLSCGKTFQGPNTLRKLEPVLKWLGELGKELETRIATDRAANSREPRLLTVQFGRAKGKGWREWDSSSRSTALQKCDAASMAKSAHELVKRWAANEQAWTIESLFISVSNFVPIPTGTSITRFLKQRGPAPSASEPGSSALAVQSTEKGKVKQKKAL